MIVPSVYASVPETSKVYVAVIDRQGALAKDTMLRVYNVEGVKIREELVNGTVSLDLPKGFYTFKAFRTYPWLGEYQTGNASLTVADTTRAYQVLLNETRLFYLQFKTFNYDDSRFLDNSTLRIELCAVQVDKARELYWHPFEVSQALPFNYIYQKDGSINQSIYQNYGVKAKDHALSFERYLGTRDQRLYQKEGYFYTQLLPVGTYVVKVWDGVHLLAKNNVTLRADASYEIQVPYDAQEAYNYAKSSGSLASSSGLLQNAWNLGVTVVDSHGNLMPNKEVQVWNENNKLVRSQVADENAHTKFYYLPEARYRVYVQNEPNSTWIYLSRDMEIKVDPITGSTVWSEFQYLSSVLSQNATHYIYRTNWGNYTFLKSAPYVSSFISRYGDACINSTFWVKPQNTILVFPFNTQVLIANNTYYKIRYEVRFVATVIAYMYQSWDFNRIDKPKTTVSLQKTAQWTQGNFEVFWISSASYVKTSVTTAVQCTSGAYSWLANTTMAEIGVSSTPQTWRSWIVFDWGDVGVSRLGTGTISVSGSGGWSIRGIIVYFNVNLGQIDPSTVGTSTDSYATRCPLQRKSFYANGRYWVFYSDGTNMVYSTSTDGSTWSSATSVRTCTTGNYFSIWFDGTYFHYAYSREQANNALFYRRGTPNSAGTVTWSANEQTVVSAVAGITYICANIAVDSGGYPWIGYRRYDGTNNYPYITKASTNDGTWTTASGFPYALSGASYADWSITAVPLTAQKVYVLYAASGITVRGKLWTGSWGSEVVASQGNIQSGIFYSTVAEGDNVHLVYLKQASYDINHRKFTYGTGWGTENTVQPSATSTSAPVLSIDTGTNNLYCFWAGKPTANRIYYSIRYASNSSWGSPNEWISDPPITDQDRLTCFYKTYGYRIGLVYMHGRASPYQVSFAYLTMPTVSITVTSSPVGCNIRVDSGAWQTSPQTYSWNPGDSHSIEAQNPYVVTTNQEQYIWASWSDSGANPHSITVPSSATTYTATMTHQWYFLASSTYDTPTGTGWYNAGSSCSGSTVTTPVSGGYGVRYQTSGYTGTGSLSSGGTYGSTTTGSFTINAYSTCTWNWITQYQPTITLTGTTSSLTTSITARTLNGASNTPSGLYSSWSDWCDSGTTLTFSDVNTGGGSSTERLHTVSTRSWSVTSAISATITYIHQWKPTITLTGTTSSLTTSITVRTLDGFSNTPSGLYSSWSDWCDDSTTLTFSTLNTGGGSSTERLHTVSTVSWSVTSALTATITYIHQWKPTVTLTGTTSSLTVSISARTLDGSSATASGLYSSWSDWCDDSTTLTFSTSNTGGGSSTERLHTVSTVSWTITSASTPTIVYIHQWKPTITLSGTTSSLTVSIIARTIDGSSDTPSGLYSSWSDWCDDSTMLTFSATSTSGKQCRSTTARSWTVTSAFSANPIWDRMMVTGYTVSDSRANINDNVNIDATVVYEYDSTAVTTGTLTINGHSASHQGSGVYRITRTSATVTSATYDTVAGSESTYGLSVVNQNSQSATVIWDRIRITGMGNDDGRRDVGTTGTFWATAQLEYDNHALGSGDSLTINSITMSWDAGNNRFEATDSSGSVQAKTYNTFTSGNEATYGITVGTINGYSTTIIWDRIRIDSINVVDDRIDVNTEGCYYATASLEYDSHTLGSGDSLLLGGQAFTWVPARSRWEYNVTKTTVQAVTIDTFTSGYEATYGITAGAMNGYSTTIIWDALQVQSLSFTYLGSGEYKYLVQMVYAYDGQAISGGTVKIAYPDGSLMSGNNTDGNGWVSFVLDGTSSGNATQSGTYDIFGDNDNNYGITYKYQNQTFSLNLLTYQKTGVNLSNALSHTITIKDGSITVYAPTISGASSFTLRMPSTAETGFAIETPATISTSAPDKCYVFMKWDDSSTNTVRSFTFTLLDKIVKAEYWYQLSLTVGPSLILTNTTEISASYDTTTKTLSIADMAPTGLYVASVNCTGFGKPETISEQGIQFTERSSFADLVNCSYYFDATAEKLWIKYFSHSLETMTIRWPSTSPPSVSPVVRVRKPPVIEWATIVLGQVMNLGKIGEGETIRFLEGEYAVLSLSVSVKEPSSLATNAYAILTSPNGTQRIHKMVLNSTSGIYQIFTTTFATANLPEGNYSLTITIENSVGRTDTYGPILIKVIRLQLPFAFLFRMVMLWVVGGSSFIIGLGLAVWYTFYWRRRVPLVPMPPPTPAPPFMPLTVPPPKPVRLPPTVQPGTRGLRLRSATLSQIRLEAGLIELPKIEELPPEIWKAEPRAVKLRKASLSALKAGLIRLEKIRVAPAEKELRVAKLRKAALKMSRKSEKPEE